MSHESFRKGNSRCCYQWAEITTHNLHSSFNKLTASYRNGTSAYARIHYSYLYNIYIRLLLCSGDFFDLDSRFGWCLVGRRVDVRLLFLCRLLNSPDSTRKLMNMSSQDLPSSGSISPYSCRSDPSLPIPIIAQCRRTAAVNPVTGYSCALVTLGRCGTPYEWCRHICSYHATSR